METIFKEIRDAIKANVKEIAWIDLDEGQMENFESPPVDYPCALIGFPAARYSNLTEGVQEATVTVTVKLAFRLWEKFNAAVPLSAQTGAFSHFDTIKKLSATLHGLPGDMRSELVRTAMQKNPGTAARVYEIVFECAKFDTSVGEVYTLTPAPPVEIVT